MDSKYIKAIFIRGGKINRLNQHSENIETGLFLYTGLFVNKRSKNQNAQHINFQLLHNKSSETKHLGILTLMCFLAGLLIFKAQIRACCAATTAYFVILQEVKRKQTNYLKPPRLLPKSVRCLCSASPH